MDSVSLDEKNLSSNGTIKNTELCLNLQPIIYIIVVFGDAIYTSRNA